jgi:hypothetical protein
MKQFFQRFVRAYQAFKHDEVIDFSKNEIPNFDWKNLPDVPSKEADVILNECIRTTGMVMVTHMKMLKIENYLTGGFFLDTPEGVEEYRLRFTRTLHEPGTTPS